MDVRLLEYFLAVVDNGGFGRAAEALHVAQPSLSQAIAGLERELGVELFHRVGRGVVLSDAGDQLVAPARQVLHDMRLARDAATSTRLLQRGHVTVASMSSPGIEPLGSLVARFTERNPGMSVAAAAAFEPQDVVNLVKAGAAELGLVGTPEPIHPPGLRMHALEAQGFVLVGNGHADMPCVDELDLATAPPMPVVVSPQGSLMRRIVDDALAAGAPLRLVVEVAHRTSILPFVLQGIGCAVVPSAWTTMARAAGLQVARIHHPARLHVALLRRDAGLGPAADSFLRIALDWRNERRSPRP